MKWDIPAVSSISHFVCDYDKLLICLRLKEIVG